jgi:hypothetical protein
LGAKSSYLYKDRLYLLKEESINEEELVPDLSNSLVPPSRLRPTIFLRCLPLYELGSITPLQLTSAYVILPLSQFIRRNNFLFLSHNIRRALSKHTYIDATVWIVLCMLVSGLQRSALYLGPSL